MSNTFFSHVRSRSSSGAQYTFCLLTEGQIALALLDYSLALFNGKPLEMVSRQAQDNVVNVCLVAAMSLLIGGLGGAIVGSAEYCLK